MWHIWKARCVGVFEGTILLATEVVSQIWQEAVGTLCGQYEAIQGARGSVLVHRISNDSSILICNLDANQICLTLTWL